MYFPGRVTMNYGVNLAGDTSESNNTEELGQRLGTWFYWIDSFFGEFQFNWLTILWRNSAHFPRESHRFLENLINSAVSVALNVPPVADPTTTTYYTLKGNEIQHRQ